jgi:hypothetical protein
MDQPVVYEICVRGRLDASWSDWLEGLTVTVRDTPDGRGITTLRCELDQAALRGLLTRLWDRNLTVVSVGLMD